MGVPELNNFILVGGTSLALQIGHRVSVDLDLFGSTQLDLNDIPGLIIDLGKINRMSASKSILVLNIDDIKVDFVNYRYPLLFDFKQNDGIRMADIRDIGAMKLAAISGRGRKRDFFDLYFLLQTFSLDQLLAFYTQKYQDGSEFLIARSLSYFADAEEDEDPVMIRPVSWKEVKNFVLGEVKNRYS
jgi:hypothetical protein